VIYKDQQLKNVVAGAAFLGAGGGGSPMQGNKLVNEVIEADKKVEVRPPNEVPDEGFVASVYGMGAPSASRLGYRNEHLRAHEMFNERYSKKIEFVVPFEIGAGNSAVPLHSGAFMGVPVVDGDGAGRAVPELQLTTFDIYGVPISPMSIAGASGEGGMLYVKTAEAAESIGRVITHVFGDMAGCVSYPMNGSTLKKVVIPDTLSLCEKTGGIIHRLKPSGDAISNELQKKMGMVELGRGLVIKKETTARGGFDYGHVDVKGKKDTLKVLFKNENIIALRNNKIVAMMPDLVCWISDRGDPLTNADVKKGQKIIALGIGANKLVRTPKAIAAFSHLYTEQGRKEPFKPMEKLGVSR
jgi:DUF917 family protein